MRGQALYLRNFFDGTGTRARFIIPVYQRNYDWLIGNCDQLFNDLIKLNKSKRTSHFFGSIVTSTDQYGCDRLVIDGQQRLTTISLLLLAGIQAVKDNKLTISNATHIEETMDTFLLAKYAVVERKIKLVPIENDLNAYDRIFNSQSDCLIEESKMTRNYKHFYDLLTRTPNVISFDELLNCIEHLQIISIELDQDDDPQLIFESLNSTGLALTEADKIRNYLLMSLSAQDQQFCFKEYWQKKEAATENDPTMFLRDYLTIMQQMQRPVSMPYMYQEWKKYMLDRDRKDELAQMLDYALFYKQITKAQLATNKLSRKMKHICNVGTDVANVFFIQFLKYASEVSISENDIYDVIDLVENYLARRIICNMPSNALTQVFCALHKDVLRSIDEYNNAGISIDYSYPQILTYHIMRRDGNYQLPRDTQFIESIKTRDAYHMIKSYQIFLFERLENAVPGEYNDVVKDMTTKEASIEHIMPQTLNESWIKMLGDDYENVKETYMHTFANLTLTGINSELSNKPFEIKRNGTETSDGKHCPGYSSSKYRLTRSVTLCEQWTATELEKRGNEIADTFLRLYPLPKTTFKPVPKPVEEASLEDETFSPTGRYLKGYRLFDKEYVEDTWKNMLVSVVMTVAERYPDIVDSLYDAGHYFWTSASPNADRQYCTELGPDRFLWTSLENKGKIRLLRYLFEKCDIPESALIFLLEPVKGEDE